LERISSVLWYGVKYRYAVAAISMCPGARSCRITEKVLPEVWQPAAADETSCSNSSLLNLVSLRQRRAGLTGSRAGYDCALGGGDGGDGGDESPRYELRPLFGASLGLRARLRF